MADLFPITGSDLVLGSAEAREYVCAAFSAENKFLITQGGPPDWTLILWSWDKAGSGGALRHPFDRRAVLLSGQSAWRGEGVKPHR